MREDCYKSDCQEHW